MSRDNVTRPTHSPERLDLLARTGVVLDTRRNTIANLEDFDRKWSLARAVLFILATGIGLWVLFFWLIGWL